MRRRLDELAQSLADHARRLGTHRYAIEQLGDEVLQAKRERDEFRSRYASVERRLSALERAVPWADFYREPDLTKL